VNDADLRSPFSATEKAAGFDMEDPPCLILTGDHVAIPLYLPCGLERDRVFDMLPAQTREIAGLLA
jgi:hypothetical protein